VRRWDLWPSLRAVRHQEGTPGRRSCLSSMGRSSMICRRISISLSGIVDTHQCLQVIRRHVLDCDANQQLRWPIKVAEASCPGIPSHSEKMSGWKRLTVSNLLCSRLCLRSLGMSVCGGGCSGSLWCLQEGYVPRGRITIDNKTW
jgi:hypothetical protein